MNDQEMDYKHKKLMLLAIMADSDAKGTGLALVETLPYFLLSVSGLDKEDAKQGIDAIASDIKDVIDALDLRAMMDA